MEKKSMWMCVSVYVHHHQTHEYRNSSTNGKQMATKRSSTRRTEVMLIHIHTHAHRAPVTVPPACSGEQYSRTFCQDAIQRLFFRTQNRLNTENGNHRILKDVAAARRHFSTPFFYFIFTRLLPLLRQCLGSSGDFFCVSIECVMALPGFHGYKMASLYALHITRTSLCARRWEEGAGRESDPGNAARTLARLPRTSARWWWWWWYAVGLNYRGMSCTWIHHLIRLSPSQWKRSRAVWKTRTLSPFARCARRPHHHQE